MVAANATYNKTLHLATANIHIWKVGRMRECDGNGVIHMTLNKYMAEQNRRHSGDMFFKYIFLAGK